MTEPERWRLAAPAPGLGRKWHRTGCPHRGARPDPYRVQQTQFSYAIPKSGFVAVPGIGQQDARRNAGCYSLAKLGQRNLWPGLENQIVGNARTTRSFPVVNPFLGDIQLPGNRQTAALCRDRQAHGDLTVVLLSELPAVLMRRPDRMTSLLWKTGVVNNPVIAGFFSSVHA